MNDVELSPGFRRQPCFKDYPVLWRPEDVASIIHQVPSELLIAFRVVVAGTLGALRRLKIPLVFSTELYPFL